MEVVACPSCGEENPAKFRLCGYCGTPLAQALPAQELRKTVTILFSDLKGSTALGERVDPEALHEIKNRYFEAMAAVIARHGGKIEKYIGDAIMAVFGLPKVREDDALRAVRAGLDMQHALGRMNVELERAYGITLAARMGINTGEVVATADPNADQRLADGDAVNVAARLEQAAPAMEVLVGDITYQLVRDAVVAEPVEPLELKGKAERVPAFRLVALRSVVAPAAMAESPLVGREEELAVLAGELDAAIGSRTTRLVTVIGDAGVGKSRLIAEFVRSTADRARVLRGRCLPYGDGVTFWPLVEIARDAAGIDEEDGPDAARARLAGLLPSAHPDGDAIVERVAAAIGLTTTALPVAELFWAIRKLLETLASERPLALVVDDIHSAEATFLELLDHLVESADAPILVLCSARHELLEQHPAWSGRPAAQRMILGPLSGQDTETMIERLLGAAGLDAGLRARVAAAAEGNPLFVEQLVSMLVDRGTLRVVGDRWEADGDLTDLAIPPTINALLAARLDHLGREERAVIEPASVIGLVFPEPAVEELVPDALRGSVRPQLGQLDRKQFVHPSETDETYRFHHLLIRDAAYNSLLKRARAQLHERFVGWAERVNRERDRETEFEEILGYHLEQAFRYRQDLGPLDDEARAIGRRAATKLASAGRRAYARGDIPAAIGLLRRAGELLVDDEGTRAELLAELGEALTEAGEFDEATRVLDDAATRAEAAGDARLGARASVLQLGVDLFSSESTDGLAEALAAARRAIDAFDRADDQAGLARAWRFVFMAESTAGRFEAATDAAERVVRHATRAGDRRMVARGAAAYASVALLGPTPVPDVVARCEDLLTDVGDDRKARAVISGVLAVLQAMAGSFDRARELYTAARRMLEELGRSVSASSTSTESGRVELLAGDPAAAERELQRDFTALGAMGERYFRSTIAGLLAIAVYEQGRFDEAAQFAGVCRDLSSPDDSASQMFWRIVEAKLAAQAGDAATAERLATEALAIVRAADSPALTGGVLVDAAEVRRLLGDGESAETLLREALSLFEQKGDAASAGRVSLTLEAVPVPADGAQA